MQKWTYTKPTKPGTYIINRGDVVTDENSFLCAVFYNHSNELIAAFTDGDKTKVEDIHHSFKWFDCGRAAADADD